MDFDVAFKRAWKGQLGFLLRRDEQYSVWLADFLPHHIASHHNQPELKEKIFEEKSRLFAGI